MISYSKKKERIEKIETTLRDVVNQLELARNELSKNKQNDWILRILDRIVNSLTLIKFSK